MPACAGMTRLAVQAASAFKGRSSVGIARSPRVVCRFFGLRFGGLRSLSSEGCWRRFMIADCIFSNARAFPSDLAAASPHCARRRTRASMRTRSPRTRGKSRAIDPTSGRNSPALKPEPVSSLGKQTGSSPSCLASISRTLAFETYPFGFRPCEGGKRPLSSGACEAPFIQRNVIMPEFRFSVKEFQNKL